MPAIAAVLGLARQHICHSEGDVGHTIGRDPGVGSVVCKVMDSTASCEDEVVFDRPRCVTHGDQACNPVIL